MIKIVALNSKYVHTLLSPYYLKENCSVKDIQILQCNINEDTEVLYYKCLENAPKVIAFSCYIFNIKVVELLARKIKKNAPEIIIILGGPEVSFDSQNYNYADYIIQGEGEIAFDKLLTSLNADDMPKERIIKGELIDLKNINAPYTQEYFKHCDGKIAYFEASRGCVFDCAYCMSGKSNLRKFTLEYVFAQLDKFAGKNIRVVKFVDRTFNADKQHAHAILCHIIQNKALHNLTFHFEIASDILSEEFFCILSQAPKNLFMFEIGVQSFNQKTLDAVARKSNLIKVAENIKRLVAMQKFNIHTDLIAGLPYEDKNSFIQSFNTLYWLGGDMLQLGFLKALKGSRLRTMMNQEGGYIYDNSPPYEIISTPCINSNELDELRAVEDVVDKFYNSGYFVNTLAKYVKDNPYEFYKNLAGYCNDCKGLDQRFGALKQMLINNGHSETEIVGYLKYDFLINNNSKILPNSIKTVYTPAQKKLINKLKSNNNEYITTIGININNGNIEDCIFIIDYTTKPYSYKCLKTKDLMQY